MKTLTTLLFTCAIAVTSGGCGGEVDSALAVDDQASVADDQATTNQSLVTSLKTCNYNNTGTGRWVGIYGGCQIIEYAGGKIYKCYGPALTTSQCESFCYTTCGYTNYTLTNSGGLSDCTCTQGISE